MPMPLTRLPEQLAESFSTAQARELGVSADRLRRSDLERQFRGIYRRGAVSSGAHRNSTDAAFGAAAEITAGIGLASGVGVVVDAGNSVGGSTARRAMLWREKQKASARSLAPFLPRGHFFSGYTAAVLWNLPLPFRLSERDEIEVSCLSPRRALRRAGVTGSRVAAQFVELTQLGTATLTDCASTWVTLAPRLGFADAVALGDAVLHRPRIPGTQKLRADPLATFEQLEKIAAVPLRRGSAKVRAALSHLVTQSASVPETHLRLLLNEWGIGGFVLDHDVCDFDGRLVGCSEIAFPEVRLALEYEGRHHLVEAQQWNRDIEKYRHYAQLGWEVLRVTSDLLYRRPEELRYQVCEALRRRGG